VNGTRVAGLILALVGLIALFYGAVGSTRSEEIELGPVEVEYRVREPAPVPPVVGGIVLVAGIVLVLSAGHRGGRRAAD
jgi:hypothetical protein